MGHHFIFTLRGVSRALCLLPRRPHRRMQPLRRVHSTIANMLLRLLDYYIGFTGKFERPKEFPRVSLLEEKEMYIFS